MRSMNGVRWMAALCAAWGLAAVAFASAWRLHDHAHAHAHEHEHEHEHGTVHPGAPAATAGDYSFQEGRQAYPAPMPAGEGRSWFKGNLHTHTLWSDGDQFPEVVTQWYVEHGYHFLALSDHNVLSRGRREIDPLTNQHIASGGRMAAVELYLERFGEHWVERRSADDGSLAVRLKPLDEFRHLFERAGRFLLIEAEEITEGRHQVHVNATNVLELIQPRTGANVEETLRLNVDAVVEQGERLARPMLPHVNHPNWQWALTAEDMIPVENLRTFEIYNGHRGVNNLGNGERAGLERLWDIVLTKRLAEHGLGVVHGVAVDDAHHYEQSSSQVARPGRGWVMVRSRFLTPEHIVRALAAGEFYASTGVTLRAIEADGSGLTVEVEPEEGLTYTIEFIGTRQGYDPASEPVLDAQGAPVRTTRRYSDEIGAVLARAAGPRARYAFSGEEIYVRARVTSSRLHPNPFAQGEREQAWVQPVLPGP